MDKNKLFKLAKMIMHFGEVEVNGAKWIYEGDELIVGLEVMIEDADGNMVPVEDGEYTIGEQKVTIANGKVAEIEVIEVKEEEVPVDEEMKKKNCMEEEAPVEEAPAEDEKDVKIKELEGLLADRDAVIEELTAKIKELEAQVAEKESEKPVEEPVQMSAQAQLLSKMSVKENPALKYFK